mmetsp:Transcript_11689/g.23800  ORF Transcript_11689/g.23800 Transcript_11689/m.23800 type:complete len:82 (+) Transcript_11689:4150-4395(+)
MDRRTEYPGAEQGSEVSVRIRIHHPETRRGPSYDTDEGGHHECGTWIPAHGKHRALRNQQPPRELRLKDSLNTEQTSSIDV